MSKIVNAVWQAQLGLLQRQLGDAAPEKVDIAGLLSYLEGSDETEGMKLAEAAIDNGVDLVAFPALQKCLNGRRRRAALEKLAYLSFGLGRFWDAHAAFEMLLADDRDGEYEEMVARCLAFPQDVADWTMHLLVEDRTKYYCVVPDGYWANRSSVIRVHHRPPATVVTLTRRKDEKPYDFGRRGDKLASLLTPCLSLILPPFRKQG